MQILLTLPDMPVGDVWFPARSLKCSIDGILALGYDPKP